MNSFLSINVNGVNWYNCGGLTVNATLDNVNSSNYNNVSDINCFTMQNKITTFEELEYEVYDFIASDVLDNTILNQIEDLEIKENNFIGKEKARKIVDNLTKNASTDDLEVIVNFESLFFDNDDNVISIKGNGKYIEIDLEGNIV